jgi:hypothetical protein
MSDDYHLTDEAAARPERPKSLWGLAAMIAIVACAIVLWHSNGTEPAASGSVVVVTTTVPPDTPPINPPMKR